MKENHNNLLKLDTPEKLEDAGVIEVLVKYNIPGDEKTFDLFNWCIFREGIINNVKCEIIFK
jgi:uncharacterized protein Smg (DUF494 family)